MATENIQRGRYGRYIHLLLTLVDFMVLNIAFITTSLLQPEFTEIRSRTVWLLTNLTYIPVAIWIIQAHKARALFMDHIMRSSLSAVGALALLLTSFLYFVGIDIPWKAFVTFYGLLCVMFIFSWTISRMALKSYRSRGRNFSRIIIIGANSTALRLYEEMMSDAGFGFKVMGFFDNQPRSVVMPEGVHIGNLDEIETFVTTNAIDEVYYTLTGERRDVLSRITHIADNNMIPFYYVPQLSRIVSRGFDLLSIGSIPVMAVRPNPLKSITNRVIKRTFDILFSSAVLLFSPLVFIPVAIAIKVSSPGPIFFKQKRTGYRGKEFTCYKFRTMRLNNSSDVAQATAHDPRKTKVGDFLRRTSIDELPQFFNVLLGNMSVVGPRPHMLRHTEQYSALIQEYMVRHMVKPGITGWAQVNGFRGQTEQLWQMEKRVEHDVWYIEHWSFILDVKIIMRTIINAIRGEKNAF